MTPLWQVLTSTPAALLKLAGARLWDRELYLAFLAEQRGGGSCAGAPAAATAAAAMVAAAAEAEAPESAGGGGGGVGERSGTDQELIRLAKQEMRRLADEQARALHSIA